MSQRVKTEHKRTTVYVPVDLLAAADRAAESGMVGSRNDLVVMGLRHMLDQLEREAIDAEFALMASDADYQREAREVAAGFAGASWEALRSTEKLEGAAE